MVFLKFLLFAAAFIGVIKLIIWVDEKAPKRVRHNITPTPSLVPPAVAFMNDEDEPVTRGCS